MWTADEVAAAAFRHYEARLPKRGKPRPAAEWTLLAAVVKAEEEEEAGGGGGGGRPARLAVVALGTGTKCIGQAQMSQSGDVLHDSHAEVVAKRSFQRSRICKVELFHDFLKLVAQIPAENLPGTLRTHRLQTYWEYKGAATSYQEAWKELRSQAFSSWVRNSRDYLNFT